MRLLSATGDPPSPEALDAAAVALGAGLPVVVPTDTVYGVAADPTIDGATRRLFALKGRPLDVALPVLVADVASARRLAELPPSAEVLVERFWPGALTVVVARRPEVRFDLGGADATTIGLRQPDHPVAAALVARVGPLATTSANRHGRPTPPSAPEVADELGDQVALVLDAGPCTGAPSTVVSCAGGRVEVLRVGVLPPDEVLAALRPG